MPKYSIIIPVYNVEKYIKKCLDSVFNQSYKDYEVIVINDGSKDESMKIVDKYDVIRIDQENKGLSAARNKGCSIAKGEYLLFLDSDDYIEKDLLKNIDVSTKNNPDLIRFQIKEVFEENNKETNYSEESFEGLNGEEAFNKIVKYHYIENAWAYVIKRDYYKKNKFEFKPGTIHEDFGLIPLIIMKSKIVNSINYIGYNYRQRSGSIMSQKNYEKTKKKVKDFYNHYLYLIKEIDKTKENSTIFKSYCANSLLIKICELKGRDYKEYKQRIKEDKVLNNLLTDTFSRRLKKRLYKISPKMTVKFLK